MAISFECEGCGKTLHAKYDQGGRRTRCPNCGASLEVPKYPVVEPLPPPEPAVTRGGAKLAVDHQAGDRTHDADGGTGLTLAEQIVAKRLALLVERLDDLDSRMERLKGVVASRTTFLVVIGVVVVVQLGMILSRLGESLLVRVR